MLNLKELNDILENKLDVVEDLRGLLSYRLVCDRKQCLKAVTILYHDIDCNDIQCWCLSHFMEMMEAENAYDWENHIHKASDLSSHLTKKYDDLFKYLLGAHVYFSDEVVTQIHKGGNALFEELSNLKIQIESLKKQMEKKKKKKKEKKEKKEEKKEEENKEKEKDNER